MFVCYYSYIIFIGFMDEFHFMISFNRCNTVGSSWCESKKFGAKWMFMMNLEI
jgi:hypothetical protein